MGMENGQGEIIVYQAADGLTRVDVRFEGDTVWLTQAQLVDLYHSSKANISEHIKHILDEGELTEEATVRKFRTVQMEGKRQVNREIVYYNLAVEEAYLETIKGLEKTAKRQQKKNNEYNGQRS